MPILQGVPSQRLDLSAQVAARQGAEAGGDAARDAVRRVPCGARPAQRPIWYSLAAGISAAWNGIINASDKKELQ